MDEWLIWSNEHHAWWAADRCGYRKSPDDAGRYTFDDAMSICRVRSWTNGVPPETMIHESAVWFGSKRPLVSNIL